MATKNSSPTFPSSRSLGKKRARPETDELGSTRSVKKRKSSNLENTSRHSARDESALVVDEHYADNEGDIYLRLRDGTHFLCHLEILKTAGGLFQELFSLPQPTGIETIHSLPFCDIYHSIVPEELRFALDFIYGKLKLLRKLRNGGISLHFSGSMAVLKVGHLLNLPNLRTSALKALHLLFPCSSKGDRWPSTVHGVNTSTALFRRLFPIHAINVFRQCEVPIFTPVAYYYAAQLDPDDILFGVTCPDGSIVKLDDSDKSLVMKGREELGRVRRNNTHAWLSQHGNEGGEVENSVEGCWMRTNPYTNQTCYAFIQRLKADWNASRLLDRPDCLNTLSREGMDILKKDLCGICYNAFEDKIKQGFREGLWQLPRVFGFGSWKALKLQQSKLNEGWRE